MRHFSAIRRGLAAPRPVVRCASRLVMCVALACVWACAITAPEQLEVTGVGPVPRTLRASLGTGTYSQELANTSFVLSDLSLDELGEGGELEGHLLHVNLLWIPKAGKTAVDPESTNTSIRLVIFSGREIGIYGGGGFAWPQGEPGDSEFGIDLVGSSLSLVASTRGFVDLLSPAQITGRLHSTLHEDQTRRMRRAASQVISNTLRSVQWVGPGIEQLRREVTQGEFLVSVAAIESGAHTPAAAP